MLGTYKKYIRRGASKFIFGLNFTAKQFFLPELQGLVIYVPTIGLLCYMASCVVYEKVWFKMKQHPNSKEIKTE